MVSICIRLGPLNVENDDDDDEDKMVNMIITLQIKTIVIDIREVL